MLIQDINPPPKRIKPVKQRQDETNKPRFQLGNHVLERPGRVRVTQVIQNLHTEVFRNSRKGATVWKGSTKTSNVPFREHLSLSCQPLYLLLTTSLMKQSLRILALLSHLRLRFYILKSRNWDLHHLYVRACVCVYTFNIVIDFVKKRKKEKVWASEQC